MKPLYRLVLIAAVAMLSTQSATLAQTSFEPENLGSSVNSMYSEINPVVSVDGKTLFFTRVNHPQNRFGEEDSQDIWYSKLQSDGTWGQAQRLPNSVNISRYNAILSALEDGKSYLILGRFNSKGTRWLTRGLSIVEQLGENVWSTPRAVDVKRLSKKNKGRVSNAFMSPDGEILIIAYATNPGGDRLSMYVSRKIDENYYSKPKIIKGGPMDARKARSVEAPFLTNDKNRLYFSANFERNRDSYDIFYAQRADDTFREWSAPEKVTDTINTPNWDSYFKLNSKESWAYFCSTTRSMGKSDIFRVKIFEEFPFIRVSGLILNQADQTLMLKDTDYRILVNGNPYDALKIDKVSASYEVLLPLGYTFTLSPQMENWNGISVDFDLRSIREYSEAKVNLYFSAIPFVLVKGIFIDTRTNLPLAMEKKPRVMVNGIETDSVKYDQFSAAFQALLPLGESYKFAPNVQNFTGDAVVVDVKQEKSYTEKNITINVTSVPWVEVKGVALDNSSFTPILGDANPRLVLNGESMDSVFIDPATGNFTVNLPFGQKHNISIIAKGYKPLDNTIDLEGYVEFTSIKQNVFAEREDANMVTLNGKLINTKTGKQLEEGYVATMRVNGVESPAFVYNDKDASYTLKLPVGFNYDLTPRVINFYNKFEPVDLTSVAPMTKIPKNFYVTPIEVGQSVDIEHIYFETGRSTLKPESYRSLNALIEFLKEYENVKVEIGGHTDNVGSASVNQTISEERAQAVADYVVKQGVPAHRIESKGYGFSKPKASNKTAEGRAQNRRVDFTIIGI